MSHPGRADRRSTAGAARCRFSSEGALCDGSNGPPLAAPFTRERKRAAAPTPSIEARLDDDPTATARAHAEARKEAGIQRRRSAEDTARLEAVKPFVDERRPPATWDDVLIDWNREHPKSRYKDWKSLRRAYKRREDHSAGVVLRVPDESPRRSDPRPHGRQP